MTSREFVQSFKDEVLAHPKLRAKHPFVQAVREGRASKEHLREWARQDYKFRNLVPLAPATAAHLYFVELIIHKYPWFVVMAAQMAAEGTFPEATEALARGLTEHYQLPPQAVRFFTVHKEADEEHGSLAEDIAEAYLHSAALQAQTREVGLRRLELLYDTWTIQGFDL